MGRVISWILTKIGGKIAFIAPQFLIATLVVAKHVLMVGFMVYAVKFFYEQFNAFMSYAANMSSGDTYLALSLSFLRAIGFINALNDVFALFSPFLIAYLTYKAVSILVSAYKNISDEIFKIGVLWQQ
jgi:hypothetical protein